MPFVVADRHALILCDLWGCLHDGVQAFPGAVQALDDLCRSGRMVILLTNAPRPSNRVRSQLDRLGIPPTCYHAIVSSGDVGIRLLQQAGGGPVGFIGSEGDRMALQEQGVVVDHELRTGTVVCTGFEGEASLAGLAALEAQLTDIAAADREMWCLNPDLVVHRGGVEELCAGAIAARYREIGGRVRWFGKPHPQVYEASMGLASANLGRAIEPSEVLAIGDGALTDMAGAARYGIDFLFVTGGIERDTIARAGLSSYLDHITRVLDLPVPAMLGAVERLSDLASKGHPTAGGYPK
jgi:HAD superfamily hydrolase (TIGR01459 family)